MNNPNFAQKIPLDPGALFPGREYPRYMHHPTKEAVVVNDVAQERALVPPWSRTYIPQEFPKVKYHWSGENQVVQNAEEEAALGGWANSPAAFEAYQGPRRATAEVRDSGRWVDDWSVPGLSSEHRNKIKAQLLRADATFERQPGSDPEAEALICMRQAFGVIAQVLYDAAILTPNVLASIEELVWDAACAGGWWRRAAEMPQDIFPERVGHYWIWREAQQSFRAEILEWTARLLEAPCAATPLVHESVPTLPTCKSSQPEDLVPGTTNPVSGMAATESDGSSFDTQTQRMAAIERYTKNFKCSQASLARAARVHPTDLSKWKTGSLPGGSDKKARIERTLQRQEPPIPPGKQH